MKKSIVKLPLLAVAMLLLSSCKRDLFDKAKYNEYVREQFPIGNVDLQHTWELTARHLVFIDTSSLGADAQTVAILSDNPYENIYAEILAEVPASVGLDYGVSFCCPAGQQQFYAAALTATGNYMAVPFTTDDKTVDFGNRSEAINGYFAEKRYQTYTYCFEEDYPMAGDYDFNDLVIRLSKRVGDDPHDLIVSATLAAVGTNDMQLACALRLSGLKYADVESAEIVSGTDFNQGYKPERYFIKSKKLLSESHGKEAVINLFEDAHWAMLRESVGDMGAVSREYVNVNPSGGVRMVEKTVVYKLRLRNESMARIFSIEQFDPFVMKDYNSGKFEIHTAPYRSDMVLHDQGKNAESHLNEMVWALKIPSGSFRWPREGVQMGLWKDNMLSGAYRTNNHSFGQWVEDHTVSTDWWRYPGQNSVY